MEIRLPNLGEGTETGTVTSLLVKVGDNVVTDQPLIELESEKAVAVVPSVLAGTITRIHVEQGQEIRVGAPIVSIDPVDGDAASIKEPPAVKTASPEGRFEAAAPEGPVADSTVPGGHPPVASPSVRKVIRDLGLDISRVRPSGRGGRVSLEDLRRYVTKLQGLGTGVEPREEPRTPSVDFSAWGPVTIQKATPIRRTIARRMTASWNTVPHVTQFVEADITALMSLRKTYAAAYTERGARLTLTPIILASVARTLQRHPLLNCSLDESSDSIVTKQYYHLGIAVDTDAGLLVPVIRDVDQKSVLEVAIEVEELAERARQRNVTKDEMEGGTFTVSNQGGIGGGYFTPIINKPEVGILGIGRGREGLALNASNVEAKILLPLALSHDHRVVDGANGVRFLVDLVKDLEAFPEAALKLT